MKERLKMLREELRLSMDKFGSRIGVTRSAISKMESGIAVISERSIISICREFRVNYFWLTEGEGDMFVETPVTVIDELTEEFSLTEMDRKIIEKYLALTPEERETICNYFKSVFS